MENIKNWFKRVGAGIAAGYIVYKNPASAKAVDKISSLAKDKNVKKAVNIAKDKNVKKALGGLSKIGKKKKKNT